MRENKRSSAECSCPTKQPQVKSFKIDGPIIGRCCGECMHVLEWRMATPEEVEAYVKDPAQLGMSDNPPVADVKQDVAQVKTPASIQTAAAVVEAPAVSVIDEKWPADEEVKPIVGNESYKISDISILTNPYIIRVFIPIGSFDIPTTEAKATAALNNKSLFVGKTAQFEVERAPGYVRIVKINKLT